MIDSICILVFYAFNRYQQRTIDFSAWLGSRSSLLWFRYLDAELGQSLGLPFLGFLFEHVKDFLSRVDGVVNVTESGRSEIAFCRKP